MAWATTTKDRCVGVAVGRPAERRASDLSIEQQYCTTEQLFVMTCSSGPSRAETSKARGLAWRITFTCVRLAAYAQFRWNAQGKAVVSYPSDLSSIDYSVIDKNHQDSKQWSNAED